MPSDAGDIPQHGADHGTSAALALRETKAGARAGGEHAEHLAAADRPRLSRSAGVFVIGDLVQPLGFTAETDRDLHERARRRGPVPVDDIGAREVAFAGTEILERLSLF